MPRKSTKPPAVQTFSLDEFFAKSYLVPAYQRNYVGSGPVVPGSLSLVARASIATT